MPYLFSSRENTVLNRAAAIRGVILLVLGLKVNSVAGYCSFAMRLMQVIQPHGKRFGDGCAIAESEKPFT